MTLANIGVLSEQYQSRTTLMVEILKMYFRLLIVFAVALFACLTAMFQLTDLGDRGEGILNFAIALSPLFLLSWFVGYLFLFWNYDIVITEMDCIAKLLGNKIGLQKSETCYLSHQQFLSSYTGLNSAKFLYVIIGSPIVVVYLGLLVYVVKLGLDGNCATSVAAALYAFALLIIPAYCLKVHFLVTKEIKAKAR